MTVAAEHMYERWLRRILFLSAFLLVIGTARRGAAVDTWSEPFPGVRRLVRDTSNQYINVLQVDLCRAGVSLRATAASERRRTAPSFGSLVNAEAAVNGDFFTPTYSTDGIAMHAAAQWGGRDHAYVAPISIGPRRIDISHHNNTVGAPTWAREVVSGHPTLLDDGTTVGNPGDPLCTNRHPRTAIGISRDHTTLIVAVVDGRASTRIGMTCRELANLMREMGAFDAVNMDGGGSSTMWLKGRGVVSHPSDGSPRVVANHLAIQANGSGASPHCPCVPHCDGTHIIDDHCRMADCAPYAATCSTAGGTAPHCVSLFCVPDADTVPEAHDICFLDGTLRHCDAEGGIGDPMPCPAGQVCIGSTPDAHCGAAEPDAGPITPPGGDSGPVPPDIDGGALPRGDGGALPPGDGGGEGAAGGCSTVPSSLGSSPAGAACALLGLFAFCAVRGRRRAAVRRTSVARRTSPMSRA